jgi:hypothetical protein
MSLRPSFAGFNLSQLKALFGSNDTSVLATLVEKFDEEEAVEDADIEWAEKAFSRIIMGDFSRDRPAFEDEEFINAVAYVVDLSQELNYSESIFWEVFLGAIADHQTKHNNPPEQLFRFLLDGRPLIGQAFRTTWSYYAYFTHEEAITLFAFVRNQEEFKNDFDYDDAEEWMREIEQLGQDVWFYTS